MDKKGILVTATKNYKVMKKVREFVDERLKGNCIHCGEWISDPSNDHVPSKSLLKEPYPTDIPTIKICRTCNGSFALDEEYLVAFLSAVVSGSTNPDHQVLPSAASILKNRNLRNRIDRSKVQEQTLFGEIREVWIPEQERINRVIVKNARGHGYFEYGDPSLVENCPSLVWAAPMENLTADQKDHFFRPESLLCGWPEIGSRAFTRSSEGQDLVDDWIMVQDGVYRYSVEGGTRVRTVLFEHIATEVRWDNK